MLPLCLLPALPVQAQTRSLSAEWTLGSDMTERGSFVGPRKPVVQAALWLYDASGWSLGGAWAAPPLSPAGSRLLLRSAYERPLAGDWQGQLALQYYAYPWDGEGRRFDRWESSASLSWRDRLVLGLSRFHYLHPGEGKPTLRWALDAGTRCPWGPHSSMQAALGLATLPQQGRYAYASLGATWETGPWRLDATLIGTERAARRLLPTSTPGHLSLSLSRSF